MKSNENILLEEFKYLFLNNDVTSSFVFEISKINENFGEYCLTLSFDNLEIKGIFSKTKEKLIEKQNIKCQFYLDKSNEEIKVYSKFLFIKNKKENLKQSSKAKLKKSFNFMPEYLKSSLNNMKLFDEDLNDENIFIILKISQNQIKLFDPIKYEYYNMDSKYIKRITDIKIKKFIYLKFYIVKEDNIICNNLTFIEKANDFQIFSILDKKITNKNLLDFNEIIKIEDDKERAYTYLFAKVILKSIKEQYVLIVDKFNKIIRLDYNQIQNLELFDLLIIINCKIQKYNDYYYNLKLTEKTIIYKSNNLIFNKKISINNYSLLNINIPDYKDDCNNYYNKLIISDFKEIEIKNPQQIYIFKFNNEISNEIVPFIVKIKNKSEQIGFKFFIVHNLITNINLFLNYSNKDKCSIEYCYYNNFENVPFSHDITINSKDYLIKNYNSFDNTNEIGFILINVPPDENINKIKKIANKKIVSSQVWYTAKRKDNKINYEITQILDIDDAKPKKYLSYNIELKKYKKFENFYFNMIYFLKKWKFSQNDVYNYFEEFNKEYESTDTNEFEFIINNNNIDFIPESANFYTYKIFTNLLLFNSLKKIKNEQKNNLKNIYNCWKDYLESMIKLIEQLNGLGKLLTHHQKIRIIDSYNDDIFYSNYPYNFLKRFFYIDEKILNDDNSYLLAFKFNIDVIKNLNEKSALTNGFKQLDSYILRNYLIDNKKIREEKTYSLINEPISLMRYHLLMNYENFIIIKSEPEFNNQIINAEQDGSNRVTFINERAIFNGLDSGKLRDEDNALPISIEFFHENSHSKRYSKNINEETPLSCYKNMEREDGKYIESLIGDKQFIRQLKNPNNKLGLLMKVDYFIKEDFNELHEKYKEINKFKKPEFKNLSQNKIKNSDPLYIDRNERKTKNEDELETLEDFEEFYLKNNVFVYPDSIPYHECPYGEKIEISQGEKEYLEKYKKQIQFDINKRGSKRIKAA